MYGQQPNKIKPPQAPKPDDDREINIDEWDDIVADRYKVPRSLMKAVRGQESGGNVNAVSPTGVRGRYQVTQSTAKQYGLDRNDPWQQSVAAARYLRDLYDQTDGADDDEKWLGSVAKYYGGGNAVKDGVVSGRSVDGLSNPAEHVRRVAERWGQIRKSETTGAMAAPASRVSPFDETEDQAKARRAGMTPAQRKEDRRQTIGAMQNELVESSRIMQPPTPPSGKATAGVFGQSRKGQAELRKAFKVDPSTGIQVFEDAGINRVNQRAALTPGIERRRDEIARRKAAYDQLTPREQLLQRIGQPLSSEAYNRVNKDKIADLRRRAFNGDKTAQAELSQIEANQQDWEPVFRPDTQAGQLVSMIPNAALKGTGALIEGAGQLPAMSQRIMGTGRNLGRRIVGLPSQSSDNILTYGIEQAAKPLGRAITQSGDMIAPENPNDQSYPAAFARGAGSLVPFAAGAALTGGSAAAPAILGAAMNVGQYQQELDRSGQNVGAARRELGSIMAALAGLTEAAGIGRLLSRWGIDRGLLNRVINTVKEGGQEYLQDYLNDINAKLIAAYDEARRIGDWNSANRIQSFIVGAGLGAAGNVAEHMATAPERAANARNIQQIQAERAPMPGIAPSVPAGTQTQVTRITPEAARAANQPVAPSVTPDIANAPTEPLTEPIATNQIPSEAIPAPSQPNAPLFPAAQQAEQDISQLQGFDKLAALEARRRGTAKTTPEQALNKEFERLNALAESPDEADRNDAVEGYNKLLARIRGSQQYAAEVRGGVAETPYRNARQVIEQRLQGLAKPKPQKAATPAVASQSAQLPDLLTQAEGFKQDAVAAEQAGNFEAAAIAYQSARDILRTANTRHGKTMAAPDLAALRQDINLQHGAFQNAQKQARDLQRQANKPTAGLPQPRRQAAQQPPPLMQSGAIVNPEGGIPAQAPKMTFTEELQRGIDQSDAARAKRKPQKRLLSRIAELGGIDKRYAGELRDVKDARRIGVIRDRAQMSPDILARQLQSEGYDVDPDDLNTLWEAARRDISDERGFRPADSAALDRRLAEEEAAYYEKVQENERANTGRSGFSVPLGESAEQQASRPQSQQLRQDTGELDQAEDEDMAALRRAKERSERENPREYGERTRPGEPAGISFSDYSVLQSRNAKAEQALYDSAPGSPRFKAAEAAIRRDARQVGIAPRHVDAMVAYALNYHSEKAFWAERGLDLDNLTPEQIDGVTQEFTERERRADEQIAQIKESTPSEADFIESQMRAVDELANTVADDPDMMAMLDAAVSGGKREVEDFVYAAGEAYGFDADAAREFVAARKRQQEPDTGQAAQVASQSRSERSTPSSSATPRQLTADERRLIQTRPVEVFDRDFDDYTRKVESLYAQAVRGEVAIDPKRLYDPAKWVGLTPEQIEEKRKAGEGAGLLAKIHGERAKRVEDGRLPARESLEQIEKYKGYSDEQLKALGKQEREGRKTRLETLENAVRVTLEKNPRGAKPEWMAEVRALDERLKGLRQPAEAKPAPTGRVIQHSQFGEVRESADQSGVAKGKLRVVDSEGAEHVIQNPRTSGNKNAAFAKSEKAESAAIESPLKGIGKTGVVGQPETHTKPSDLTKDLNSEIRLLPAQEPSESDARAAQSIPTFQGGKTKMARAATGYIRRFFGQDAAKITEIDDWFAGSGSWGAYLAKTVFPNVKKIRIYEFNPARAAKVELFHQQGNKIAELAKDRRIATVFERAVTELDKNGTFSGTAVASAVSRAAGGDSAVAEGLLQAIIDQGTASFATQGKTGREAVQSVLRSVERNAREAYQQIESLRQRGVEFEYVVGNSYEMDAKRGSHILSVVDPPYYGTKGYNGQTLVGLKTYRDTANMLDKLRNNQNSIIYTDEAWWEKHDESGKSIIPPDAPENLFGDSGKGTLTSIKQGMGDFFRIPIAGRIETVGLYNGTQSTADSRAYRSPEAQKSANQPAGRTPVEQPAASQVATRSVQESGSVPAKPDSVKAPAPGAPVTYRLYRGVGEKPNDFGVAGKGEYWSGRKITAETYAGRSGRIIEGSVSLKRPLSLPYSELNKLQTALYGKPLTGFEEDLSAKFDQWLRSQGYDGVVLFDPEISSTVPSEVVKLAAKPAEGKPASDVDALLAAGAITPEDAAKMRRKPKISERRERADVENSPEFKRWFGDSKVVDENGKPLVVYHGATSGGFDQFDPARSGRRDDGWLGKGHYFSRSPQAASGYTMDYSGRTGDGASVYPVYLKLQNPLVATTLDDFANKLQRAGVDPNLTGAKLTQAMQGAGFDGAMFSDMGEIVVFSPSQIKSAFNRGTFDPQSPKISERRESPGAMPERYTGRQLFENARVQFRPARNRPATLVANDWGGAMMNRLLSDAFNESFATTDANFSMDSGDFQIVRNLLAEARDSGIYDEAQTANMDALLGQIDAAIKDAEANNQDVAFVTRKAGEPISQTKIKVRHETAHVSQSRVTPDMFALTERDWLGKQPEAAAVRAELERRGYPPETHAHESAVFVASGDFDAFGMNLDQATKFLSNYFKAVVQKHGRRALDRFGAIDPRLQPTLERARNEKTEAGQTANERRSVSYSPGTRRTGTAGTEAGRSGAGVLARRREGAAGVPRISERKEGFSFGRLENEPEGQIAAAGLGALQNLAGKIKKTKTPDAVPADYDVWDFYDQVMKQIMPGKDKQGNTKPPKTKINNEQADAIANGLLEMVEAADKQDFVGIFNAREKVRQALLPAAKRDVKWYDHMQSRLSNLNYKGTYERIAGADGKAVSELFRQAQVDMANGEASRTEAIKNLRKELRPYIKQFQLAGKPGLARWIENHINAVTDPDQSFKGLAGFLKGFQFYTKLAYNPRSAMVNLFQPMQTLWPHLSTREWLTIQKRATSRKEWQRIGEIAARESGGSIEGLARPDAPASAWRQSLKTGFFGYASEYNRVVGHLAGEMMADRQGITGKEKERMAADWAKKVEFDNSQWDIPPLFSSPVAGVVGQFKPFMVKNLERLYADWKSSPYAHQKGKDYKFINPSGNLARRSKMITGQLVLGGVKSAVPGIKFIGGVLILGGLAKAFGKFMDDDDAEKMAEAVYFGLPGLVEQDLSGSVTVFDEPFGKTAEEKMVNFFGGPTLSLAAKAWNTYGKVADAKDTDKSTAAEKRNRALLSLGKSISPYVKTGQAIAAAAKGETPKMWMGKDVPMTKAEAIGYGLMGTPLRQSKYYAHEDAPDWQKEIMPDRFTQSASTKTEFLNKFGQMAEQEIKRKPGEPDAVYQKRVERVSGWMNTYGEKLVNHPMYNMLTAEQKQKAIENLRDRVGKQMNMVKPNERTLEPTEVIKAVRKAATRKPRRGSEQLWESEN